MRKLSSFVFIVFLAIGGLTAKPAPSYADAAPAITAQGATDLQKLINDNLQWRLDLTKAIGEGASVDGAVTVVPKTSFYEVTLNKTALHFSGGEKIDIGNIVFHAVPGKDGEWLVSSAVPADITLYDKTGAAAAKITLGKQNFAAVWRPDQGIWPKFDISYQDIHIKSLKKDGPEATIGAFTATMNLKQNADGTWSGPNSFGASDISVNVPGTPGAHMTIAKASSNTAYKGLDMAPALALKKALETLYADGKTPNPADVRAQLGSLLSGPPVAADGMDSSFEVSGLSIQQNAGVAGNAPEAFGLDKISFTSTLQDGRKDKSRLGFHGNFDGLKVSGVPAAFTGLTPQTLNLEFAVDNLPLKKIMETLMGSLLDTAAPQPQNVAGTVAKAAAQAALKEALLTLPKTLEDAGVSFTVRNSYMKSADVETDLAGKLGANPAAVFGLSGDMTLSIQGLETVVHKLHDEAVKPGADLSMMGYVNTLTILQMAGQVGKAADGAPLRSYHFEVTPDGKLLLNGVDFKAVAALMSPRQPPQQGAPANYTPIPKAAH